MLPGVGALKVGTFRESPGHAAALERVQAWTRARFNLAEGDTVSVSQINCVVPGCPPIETVVAFWTAAGATRHHFKVFKPVVEVVEDDLPPSWMKNALAATEGCECC